MLALAFLALRAFLSRHRLPWSFARRLDRADVFFVGANLGIGQVGEAGCWSDRRRRLLLSKGALSPTKSSFACWLAPRRVFGQRLASCGRVPRRRQVRERGDRPAPGRVGNGRRRLRVASLAGADGILLRSLLLRSCWLTSACNRPGPVWRPTPTWYRPGVALSCFGVGLGGRVPAAEAPVR